MAKEKNQKIILMKTGEATSTIYVDLETFAGEKPGLDSITADGRLKDPAKIAADIESKLDTTWRKQALSSIKGEIFCVGVAVDDEPGSVLYTGSEEATLKLFDTFLNKFSFPTLVAHRGMDFDFLFLFHKGLKYGLLNLISLFDKGPQLKDTMKMLDGPSWKTMTSLDNMCQLLLGESAKGDITGKDVFDLILNEEYDRICEYCKTDVEWLRKCYNKLASYGLHTN